MQDRNRDTDVENKCMDTKGGRGWWDKLGDWDWHIYAINIVCIIDTGKHTQYSVLSEMERKSKKGDICMHIADSLCCKVETNTTL